MSVDNIFTHPLKFSRIY